MVEQTESNNSKLRFAAIVRVSTEQQEKDGESLLTQKTEIENAVKELGGTIVAWYGGQAHATPGHEKKEIDRLLLDAQKNMKGFDAVIVTNADRWSRDNEKSREGLEIFRAHGVKFFVGTSEYYLRNPEHCLFLGMSSVIGEFFASNQKRKSLINRIHRAKRGIPTGGKLPYGRTYEEENGWCVDKEKQAIIQTIAQRYLDGEKLPALAKDYDMNHSNLHKILTKRCGDSWTLKFNSDDLKIHEEVPMQIPPLLNDNIIKAIRKKTEANKTYQHGQTKNLYLLSRMVFCKHCGYAMFGQTNHNGHRYYRHAHTERERECNRPKTWINADELEDIIIRYLFECFGNPLAVQKAIEKAVPNLDKILKYQTRIEEIEGLLNKIKSGREKILRFITNEKITESEAANQLDELKQREIELQTERQQLYENMESSPTPEKIKAMSNKVSAQFRVKLMLKKKYANRAYGQVAYDEKRALVGMVFSGKTPEGQRMGVYIEWNEKGWMFDIHGHFIDELGLLPLSNSLKKAYFGNDMSSGWKQEELLNKTKYAWRSLNKSCFAFHFTLSGAQELGGQYATPR